MQFIRPKVCFHGRRQIKNVGLTQGDSGARAYNGGLGKEPPSGSRGRASGQGVTEAKPLKLKNLQLLDAHRKQQIFVILRIL